LVRDDYIVKSFLTRLKRELPGFRKQSSEVQHHFGNLILEWNTKRREHKKYKGYMFIPYQELYSKFGRGKFLDLNDKLDIFEVTDHWLQGSYTRGYKPKEHVKKIRKKYLDNLPRKLDSLVSSDNKTLNKAPKAVASKDMNGVTEYQWYRKKDFKSNVKADIRKLKEYRQTLKDIHRSISKGIWTIDAFFTVEHPVDIQYKLDRINTILRYANNKIAPGHVIHRYFACSTGRLYAKKINLQTMPKQIKQAALHGLWEYDFENCHYAIFKQLAKKIGIECPAISDYLKHKKAIRKQISEDVDITLDDTKTCLIAVIYGANSFEWYDAAIPERIGLDKSIKLSKHPKFKAIHGEVRTVGKEIINQWPSQRGKYKNAMGKAIDKTKKQNEILAHLIQGIEASMLNTVLRNHPKSIVLLQHDGFASKYRLDTKVIKQKIKEATGFTMLLSEEQIQIQEALA